VLQEREREREREKHDIIRFTIGEKSALMQQARSEIIGGACWHMISNMISRRTMHLEV
jgi:hypothetical protein